MVQLTTQERIFVVRLKEKNVPIAEIQYRFTQRFNRPPPTNKTILRNHEKYLTGGTSLNRNEHNSGRRRTKHVQHKILRQFTESYLIILNLRQYEEMFFNYPNQVLTKLCD